MSEDDPDKLVGKAKKKLTPGFFKAIFSYTQDRLEEAHDLYHTAAELYKMRKEFSKAAECFIECAQLKEQLGENASYSYKDAMTLYQKINDVPNFTKVSQKCIQSYLKNGKYSYAGDLEFEKGNSYQKSENYDKAIESYNQALDYYSMDKDRKKSSLSKVREAKADLIIIGKLDSLEKEAKEIYDDIANEKNESSVGKILAEDYYVKNTLLYFIFDDYISAKAYFHKYVDMDSQFEKSPFGKLITGLIEMFEKADNKEEQEDEIDDLKMPMLFFNCLKSTGKGKEPNSKKWWDVVEKRIEEKYNLVGQNGAKNIEEEDDFK